jgi:hypothetical protein
MQAATLPTTTRPPERVAVRVYQGTYLSYTETCQATAERGNNSTVAVAGAKLSTRQIHRASIRLLSTQ